ncbi:MAG TPA: tRNA (N(6)-L-threonylcarbamoyladenosine(37)-C(2))-methylthiotransferase [Candidatus Bathyarchaeia archaeon]|nr:tRNA (N(6)-L-threonylcarbamoyladenosine(37)-C(2))-methylthiotransferase [Candidatus Bathyarchaeia archaeon]
MSSVFVRSFGCSSNAVDGEVMAGCLRSRGFVLVPTVEEADVVIYNTCGVKMPTEDRMIHLLRQVPADKRLIVAGCLPLIHLSRLSREVRFDALVGPASGEQIVDVVGRVLNGEKYVALMDSLCSKPSLNLPRVNVNPLVRIVPIAYGCVGECSYCCVRFARGRLRSFGPTEVAEYVSKNLREGAKEFWLTGQDVASYGLDLGVDIVDLLRKVCCVDAVGEFWIRVGMSTPNLLRPLVKAFGDFLTDHEGCGRVFEFLHVPIQSGDDGILTLMRRRYSVDDFKQVISAFRRVMPRVTIATDVIVGFPGESEQAFGNTIQLLKEVKPDIVNVSKFFARPGTEAERMKGKVELGELKRRSEIIARLAREIGLEKNKAWVGWSGQILIEEKGEKRSSWVGRNFAYKPIVVRCNEDLLGRFLNVRVVEAHQSHLLGKVI